MCVCVSDCHDSEFILPVIYSLYNYNAQHQVLTATYCTCTTLMHPTNHLHVAGVTVYVHVGNGFIHPVLG